MESKQRVVFLPGHLCTGRLWQAQIDAIGDDARCQVMALYDADNIAGLAKHVLDHAPDRFSLAGLSMGGYVAMEIMRQAPQRVERLALLNTSATPEKPETTVIRMADRQMAVDHGMARLVKQLAPRWLAPTHSNNTAFVEIIVQMAEAVGVHHQKEQQKAIINRLDSRRSLQAVACPTLVLCGRQDAVTPVFGHEEMTALIPNAHLEIIEQCGHLSPLEQPDAVSKALLKWLTWY